MHLAGILVHEGLEVAKGFALQMQSSHFHFLKDGRVCDFPEVLEC